MFLKKLNKEWRLMFWVLLMLIAGQVFFMFKGIENIPFFLYHMYSKAHPRLDSVPVYLLKTNSGYFNHKQLSNREEEMLMNSLIYYCNLKKNRDGTAETVEQRFKDLLPANWYQHLQQQLINDDTRLDEFPAWWGRYMAVVSNKKDIEAAAVKSYVYAVPPYLKSKTDSVLFSVSLK